MTKLIAVLMLSVSMGCMAAPPNWQSKPASPATVAAQKVIKSSLPSDDGSDADFARRGFIATLEDPLIRNSKGEVVWDTDKFSWVKGEAPSSVNPSLWRQTGLLAHHGLFKVADGVWQVRGLDMSNMTVVRGDRDYY